jgi:hypothetical protein
MFAASMGVGPMEAAEIARQKFARELTDHAVLTVFDIC